jgi:hypothetical protein
MIVSTFRVRLFALFFLLFSFLNAACSPGDPTVTLDLTGYNHTERSIGSYSVSIPGGTGTGAGYLGPGEGGGGFTCCVTVPKVWQDGMKITVSRRALVNGKPNEVLTTVAVPKYDETGASFLSVHFLRAGGIKVFVTKYGLYHRNYPLKGVEAELRRGVPIVYDN